MSHKNWNMDIYSSLFTTAKLWKPPECPSLVECINILHPENGMLFHAKKQQKKSYPTMKDMEDLLHTV